MYSCRFGRCINVDLDGTHVPLHRDVTMPNAAPLQLMTSILRSMEILGPPWQNTSAQRALGAQREPDYPRKTSCSAR